MTALIILGAWTLFGFVVGFAEGIANVDFGQQKRPLSFIGLLLRLNPGWWLGFIIVQPLG